MKAEDHYHQSKDEYRKAHEYRWQLSLEWLARGIDRGMIRRVLEVGGESEFTSRFMEEFDDAIVSNADFDVRDPDAWDNVEEERFDLVLCMEVIEHLSDFPDPGVTGTYYAKGVLTCLTECYRVLRTGGTLFLTTPNLNSVASLSSLLAMDSVYTWAPHVHELAFNDAIELVKRAGFNVKKAGTEDPYLHRKPKADIEARKRATQILSQFGFDLAHRGETTFILGVK